MVSLKNLKNTLLYIVCLNLFLPASDGMTSEEVLDSGLWKQIESKHVIIQYKRFEDLLRFDENIDYSPDGWSLNNLFSSADPQNPARSVTRKMDGIFEKVQKILDMRRKIKKISIQVYPNREQLHKTYFAITGEKCNYRAWYIFEINTIYINNDDVHEGIIAHEMAHSIIDHYFSVRPPRAMAEILSRYVDQHLDF